LTFFAGNAFKIRIKLSKKAFYTLFFFQGFSQFFNLEFQLMLFVRYTPHINEQQYPDSKIREE